MTPGQVLAILLQSGSWLELTSPGPLNPESGGAMVLTPALPAAPAGALLVFGEKSELTSLGESPQLCYRALKGRLCNSSACPKQCQV